jgi:protein O-GlcNAc transferase
MNTSFEISILGHETSELSTAALSCLSTGQAVTAEALYQAALMHQPWDADLLFGLFSAQYAQSKPEADLTLTLACDRMAWSLIAGNTPEALGTDLEADERQRSIDLWYSANQMAGATTLTQLAAEAFPDQPAFRIRLGLSLMHQGRISESIAAFEQLERRWPSPAHHSFLHYARAFRQDPVEVVYEEGLRYAERHLANIRRHPKRPISRVDGRLRIGYFSPLFNNHQLTRFFAPAFENHDRSKHFLVCYSQGPATDEVGHGIKSGADLWREVQSLSDDAFADQVSADKIDVFIDLWGHTAGNRLPVFARKPAPLQLSWINYVETTGLADFDYVIQPDGEYLPGCEALYTEEIWRIGPVLAPFRPGWDLQDSGPTPARQAGHFSFGAFIHPGKLNAETVQCWASILCQVAGSTLTLRSSYFADPVLQRSVVARFAAFGVASEQINFPGFLSGEAFLKAYQEMDLILDPFPYQGRTTTLDALSAGVPVLALEGLRMNDRVAPTTLRACGLETLIAKDRDEYIEKAVHLSSNLDHLDVLRGGVRQGFESSAYRDARGFMRRLEADIETMIRHKGLERT